MKKLSIKKLDFEKVGGLIPAIVQDGQTKTVLMLGYQNKEAIEKSLEIGKVTFFSRTKQRLWTKGETSGNFLKIIDVAVDCDNDALLWIVVSPEKTCHTGKFSCFD
jgi:phosphoribosyl-ATP pyrophosphohydrolase/phosphoribosyl-AMP cyclohydrolase